MKYLIYLLFITLILLRYQQTLSVYKNGDFVRITSRVYSEPIIYDTSQYLKLQGLKMYLPKYPEINYGDRVVITGTVNDKKLQDPKIQKLQTDDRGFLLNLRLKLISFYKSSLPEPMGSLVAGIVIGSKNMPESFWDMLKKTGTAHIVVASGTNVTLTIGFLISFLTTYLNRRKAIYFVLIGVFAYVVLSGFDAPIVRAGIMGSILLIGQEKGRVINSWRILIYSAVIMLLIKPNWITDIGFILSFTATISLMFFGKIVSTRLKIIPAIFREGLSTSIAAQIGVAPMLYFTFGQFNILSPIINMLVLWTVPIIMVGGAAAGLIGMAVPLVGRLMLFVIYPILWYFVKIIYIF